MSGRKKTMPDPSTQTVMVLPTPVRKINLHNLVAVRTEAAAVYRGMRSGDIKSQDGARLIYALGEIKKMFIEIEFEQRLRALENGAIYGEVIDENT
ncbi:MAG: hypothetical protein LBV44_05765 [Methylobacillus sp.]|jgi:hypothetical protein|nr:hypothetical protein [Methylobacillus sp.]